MTAATFKDRVGLGIMAFMSIWYIQQVMSGEQWNVDNEQEEPERLLDLRISAM
jgi:hypothetical protein